jgi:hypothetical protein
MALEQLNLKLTGTRPLLMHNGRLADPIGEHKKALSEATTAHKRQKTDESAALVRRQEWLGGLYQDSKGRICITDDMACGVFINGAKKMRLGAKAKCVVCTESTFVLEYPGPKDPEKLYEVPGFVDYRGVVVGQSRVYRTRPRFNEWSVTIGYLVDTEELDIPDVMNFMGQAGILVGLGDYRPRFGSFDVKRV